MQLAGSSLSRGWWPEKRSYTWAARATVAASRAGRRGASEGKNAWGAMIKIDVKVMRARNGNALSCSPGWSTVARAATCSPRGLHQATRAALVTAPTLPSGRKRVVAMEMGPVLSLLDQLREGRGQLPVLVPHAGTLGKEVAPHDPAAQRLEGGEIGE